IKTLKLGIYEMVTVLPRIVVSQDPEEGAMVREGTRVQLVIPPVISQRMVTVPNVIGMKDQEAKLAIEKADLYTGVILEEPPEPKESEVLPWFRGNLQSIKFVCNDGNLCVFPLNRLKKIRYGKPTLRIWWDEDVMEIEGIDTLRFMKEFLQGLEGSVGSTHVTEVNPGHKRSNTVYNRPCG